MDHPDEKPDSADFVRKRGPGARLANQRMRMRMWQQKSAVATNPNKPVGAGLPRKRIPSLPPTPWDKKPDVAD